jgi:phage-related protein
MSPVDKPLIWLRGKIKTPPFSPPARLEAGYLLRRLQQGDVLGMPHSRPMRMIGAHCHELRIHDVDVDWRLVYRSAPDAVVILHVFSKKTRTTPRSVIEACRKRLKEYDRA